MNKDLTFNSQGKNSDQCLDELAEMLGSLKIEDKAPANPKKME